MDVMNHELSEARWGYFVSQPVTRITINRVTMHSNAAGGATEKVFRRLTSLSATYFQAWLLWKSGETG